jgi:hypothetical protein
MKEWGDLLEGWKDGRIWLGGLAQSFHSSILPFPPFQSKEVKMKTNSSSVAAPAKVAAAPTSRSYWLYNKQWDLTFIILSSSLIALPLVLNLGLNKLFGLGLTQGPNEMSVSPAS